MFKVQEGKLGANKKYKARLCARGFKQREGIDYNETFARVVRYDTIRTVLAVAASEDLEAMQFDIKTAFLHGDCYQQD